MESIDLNLDDLEPININFGEPSSQRSVNFGSGIELLINDKNRASNHATTIDMKDLDNLENELNDLSTSLDGTKPASSSSNETRSFGGFSNFFGGGKSDNISSDNIKIITEDDGATDSNVGKATAESISGNTKTWDGYSKMSDVPPNTRGSSFPSANK